jgi:hypothetical protein
MYTSIHLYLGRQEALPNLSRERQVQSLSNPLSCMKIGFYEFGACGGTGSAVDPAKSGLPARL